MLLGEHHDGVRVLQHEANAFGGILPVDRHISPARFPHGQQAHEHVDRALKIDGNQRIRLHPEDAQLLGQSLRPIVELSVSQLLPGALRRKRIRANASLLLHHLVHAAHRRISHRGLIPELD